MEKQRHIGDLLRFADKEIKNGNLDLAMAYIKKIFELEAKNVYAKAYYERISSLFELSGLSRADAVRKVTEIHSQDLPLPASVAIAPAAAKQEPARTVQGTADPSIVHPPAVAAPPPPQQPIQQSQPQLVKAPAVRQIQRSAAALEAYKTLLMEIWKDGAVSNEEQLRINSMRETFAITAEEHSAFEVEVRHTLYLNAISDMWRKGFTNFDAQRKLFLITDKEQLGLEPKVFQLVQSLQSKGSVLVLDDEIPFLTIIKTVLEEGGYYCFTAVTGEEGLHLLQTMTPDIVICDINFSKPHMSGFAFYEKFRSIDKFVTTPFIFLSGLDQDVLVRTGKKLGADDYLFKPIDTEMLLATVEGKLRRSRELKRAM